MRRLGSAWWALALGLLLGGALGNLTDRLFREPSFGMGHVVDFIQLPNFAIFNIADSAVVSAVVIICILTLRGIALDGSRHRRERRNKETRLGPPRTVERAALHRPRRTRRSPGRRRTGAADGHLPVAGAPR